MEAVDLRLLPVAPGAGIDAAGSPGEEVGVCASLVWLTIEGPVGRSPAGGGELLPPRAVCRGRGAAHAGRRASCRDQCPWDYPNQRHAADLVRALRLPTSESVTGSAPRQPRVKASRISSAGAGGGRFGRAARQHPLGMWWVDPAVGLVIALACVQAGRQTWRGEGCSCTECAVPAVRAPP